MPTPPLPMPASSTRSIELAGGHLLDHPYFGGRTVALFWAGWLACLALSASVCRALYADGGYAVLGLLKIPRQYIDFDAHRSFASYITQTPILLGERLGIHKVPVYAGLYTLGDFVPPAVLFLVALTLARKVPMLFAATAAAIVVFGFGSNFINTEANLLFALSWLAAVILALPGPRPFLRGFALPAIAFVLLRVYEGTLLVGPVLSLWALLSSRRTEDSQEQVGLTLATLLFLLGAFIGFSSFAAPRDPGNAANFAGSMLAYLRNPQLFVLFAAACSLVATTRATTRAQVAWVALAAALGLVFFGRMVQEEGYYAYSLYYDNRSFLVCLLALAVAALSTIERLRPAWLSRPVGSLAAVAAMIPFVAVVGGDLLGSARWYAYMRAFCEVLADPVAASAGIVRLKASGAVTGWPWTHPTMSILLRQQGSSAIVLNDAGQWAPFDPRVPIRIGYAGACESRRFAPSNRTHPDSAR
jgi:hypothetical protein